MPVLIFGMKYVMRIMRCVLKEHSAERQIFRRNYYSLYVYKLVLNRVIITYNFS